MGRKFRGLKRRRKHEGIKEGRQCQNRQDRSHNIHDTTDKDKRRRVGRKTTSNRVPHSALDSSSTSRRCENRFRAGMRHSLEIRLYPKLSTHLTNKLSTFCR